MNYLIRYWDRVLELFLQHVQLTVTVLVIALAIALPLGILLARFQALATPVMGLLGIIYTIPSMALFAMLIPFLGLGAKPAVTALTAYSQVILVRNVVVGLQGVDPAVLEAAVGMGMNPWQVFWRVRLPLALPVMLAGLRVAAVSVIAIGTLAAWINAGGLGVLLFEGLYQYHQAKIVIGTVSVALLSFTVNFLLQWGERRLRAWN